MTASVGKNKVATLRKRRRQIFYMIEHPTSARPRNNSSTEVSILTS